MTIRGTAVGRSRSRSQSSARPGRADDGEFLGLAGIRALVVERNAGLLGLPRAIAYDAETLRLFTQVGLFDGSRRA